MSFPFMALAHARRALWRCFVSWFSDSGPTKDMSGEGDREFKQDNRGLNGSIQGTGGEEE